MADVLPVPSDSVDAQLAHLVRHTSMTGAKVAIVPHTHTLRAIERRLPEAIPVVFDLTLTGPSGEDLVSQTTLDDLIGFFERATLVTMRRTDAELVSNTEIRSLDDAQVAAQRLHRRGAAAVLLRCGVLPMRHFDAGDGDSATDASFMLDLLYDGNDFSLYEAPKLNLAGGSGLSSALTLAILHALTVGDDLATAVQKAKHYVAESTRHVFEGEGGQTPNFFWQLGRHA